MVFGWRKYRSLIIVTAIAATAYLWWLFRPELLFISKHASESAPSAIAEIQPLFTGSLHALSDAPETAGRVNVLKTGDSLQLEISNLQSEAATSFEVALALAVDRSSPTRVLGKIAIAEHQTLTIPPGIDPAITKTVLLTDDSQRILATATLEPF